MNRRDFLTLTAGAAAAAAVPLSALSSVSGRSGLRRADIHLEGTDHRGLPVEDRLTVVIDGRLVWDPRRGAFVSSDNPALRVADLIRDSVGHDEIDWDSVARTADLCDAGVDPLTLECADA